MHLLDPEFVDLVRRGTLPLLITGLVMGLLLWLTGWWAHRFWIVLGTTVAAGIVGLYAGPNHRMHALAAGLLLAVAAGVLALSLVRLLAFVAGGVAAWLAVHNLAPASWDIPFACFLAGGLAGVLLFRVWTMALTSFAGSLVMAYAGLSLGDHFGKLNALAVCEQRAGLLNIACVTLTLVGLAAQFLFERRRLQRAEWHKQRIHELTEEGFQQIYRPRWWSWGRRTYRRAG